MIINYEFLSEEAIENVITCMNYKVDKVVFFGFYDTIVKQKKQTEFFLKNNCGVKKVNFISLSQRDLVSVYNTMELEVQRDSGTGNLQFFDISGGESLILVAFGMLAKEYKLPMHIYDIVRNHLIELEEGALTSISSMAEKQNVVISIDQYIRLRGGVITSAISSKSYRLSDVEFEVDTERAWSVVKKYNELWNPFSHFITSMIDSDDSLDISGNKQALKAKLNKSSNQLDTYDELEAILADLIKIGIIVDKGSNDTTLSMQFKNSELMECIKKSGNILELHTYRTMKNSFDESLIDICIDWDGVIHAATDEDVSNEIDVIGMSGVIPTFISCKSGKMTGNQGLHAMYELLTIKERFGGKYSRMILAVAQKMSKANELRAKEMGIEVIEMQ